MAAPSRATALAMISRIGERGCYEATGAVIGSPLDHGAHTWKECERQADNLNAFERTVARMERVSGDTIGAFSCLPCTVDPRPEGALLHDNADPRGPKGK